MKRFILYVIRWQLSTPILAPIVAIFKHSPSMFGTKEDWLAAAVANLIGSFIFFWIDRYIFRYSSVTGKKRKVSSQASSANQEETS
jgi:uncharacterized membrane protein YdjX (TVP38/TMEM64 family)